jgi:hypothetical protein
MFLLGIDLFDQLRQLAQRREALVQHLALSGHSQGRHSCLVMDAQTLPHLGWCASSARDRTGVVVTGLVVVRRGHDSARRDARADDIHW